MEILIPTVGRIVHYFEPSKFKGNLPDGSPLPIMSIAAIVTDGGDLAPCLTLMPKGEPPIPLLTVPHKSFVQEGEAYWDWPLKSDSVGVVNLSLDDATDRVLQTLNEVEVNMSAQQAYDLYEALNMHFVTRRDNLYLMYAAEIETN